MSGLDEAAKAARRERRRAARLREPAPRPATYGSGRRCKPQRLKEPADGWQPERVGELASAIGRLEREFPGWWWRVGACHVSADASIGPDVSGPDKRLLFLRQFDDGFHADLRQPATCASALHDVIDQALAAIAATGPVADVPPEK